MPDQDAVVVITAETGNMQGELNALWEILYPAFGEAALAEDADTLAKVKEAEAGFVAHPQAKKGK